MELNKNKYNAKEVEKIVNEEVAKVQMVVDEQKEKISNLLESNKMLEIELFALKSKESLIFGVVSPCSSIIAESL